MLGDAQAIEELIEALGVTLLGPVGMLLGKLNQDIDLLRCQTPGNSRSLSDSVLG